MAVLTRGVRVGARGVRVRMGVTVIVVVVVVAALWPHDPRPSRLADS